MDKETLTKANKCYDAILNFKQGRKALEEHITYPMTQAVREYLISCIDTTLIELEKQFEQL